MDIDQTLEDLKTIQDHLLDYIEDEENTKDNFYRLIILFDDLNITDDHYDFKSILKLIVKISNNHHHGPKFYHKIDNILNLFKDEIKKYFTNSEIFNIFKSNKRILLFLIENKVMTIDKYIVCKLMKDKYKIRKYPQFFLPEIKPFITRRFIRKYLKSKTEDQNEEEEENEDWIHEIISNKISENFYTNRKSGENDTFVCQLIQKDSVEEFITYVNKINYSLKSAIKPSVFETNSNLLRNEKTSLIEYAAFFGSIQIFNYLRLSNIELTSSLWLYAIHGQNAELIHLLEENHIEPSDKSFKQCYKEAIKCHSNGIASYIENNYLLDQEDVSQLTFIQCLKYYNFAFIQNELINQSSFFDLCKYDYYSFVNILLNDANNDINRIIILIKIIFFIQFSIKNFDRISHQKIQ